MTKSTRGSVKGLPESVYKLVVAEVGDYERKKQALEKGGLSREQAIEYDRKVTVIDTALQSACAGETRAAQRALLSDIAAVRGYHHGAAAAYYPSKKTYIKRKGQAVTTIAKLLELI